jgi:hypothetical protein
MTKQLICQVSLSRKMPDMFRFLRTTGCTGQVNLCVKLQRDQPVKPLYVKRILSDAKMVVALEFFAMQI